MTTTNRPGSRRSLDAASVVLMLIGLASAALAYWLITVEGFNALVLVPSVVAFTTGASHLTKREAPRQ